MKQPRLSHKTPPCCFMAAGGAERTRPRNTIFEISPPCCLKAAGGV